MSTCRTLQRAACLALFAGCTAVNAAGLDTWVGAVGGAGVGYSQLGCTTYGPPPSLSFFSPVFALPAGGVTNCGYSGGVTQTSAASGPLTQTGSLGPVSLGNPASNGAFTSSGDARADFGSLGVATHASISGGTATNSFALFDSVAAARFSDTLTATSPLVANGSAGYARYTFSVDGQATALGQPAAYFWGNTYMELDVQQGTGPAYPVYQVLNSKVARGSNGTINSATPPAGWTSSMGSLSGGSTFYSVALPMVWGQAFDLQVGLLAWAHGTADADFLNTAKLTGVTLMNANQQVVSNFSLTAASGTNYVSAVPETSTAAMLVAGVGLLAVRRRRVMA